MEDGRRSGRGGPALGGSASTPALRSAASAWRRPDAPPRWGGDGSWRVDDADGGGDAGAWALSPSTPWTAEATTQAAARAWAVS